MNLTLAFGTCHILDGLTAFSRLPGPKLLKLTRWGQGAILAISIFNLRSQSVI